MATVPTVGSVEVKEWDTKGNTFAEIWGDGTELALLSSDMKMIHPFVYCKDFMTDVFWAIANKCVSSIYSFEFDPKKNVWPDMEKIRILVKNVEYAPESIPERAQAIQSFLNSAEEVLGFEGRTVCSIVSNPEDEDVPVVYVESPRVWRENIPLKFSMYTMLVRMAFDAAKPGEDVRSGMKRIIKEGKARDVKWSKPSLPLINDIFDKGFEAALEELSKKVSHTVYTSYDQIKSTYNIHHMSGPYATFTGTSGG